VAPGRAAWEQGSGASVEGARYGEMAGGLARGRKKEKKRNGLDPRQQCHLLIIQKNSNRFKLICLKDGLPVL
jgi:hypothetical protein